MIKNIIFDLDGVLVDTKKIHFKALNQALKKYENFRITFNEHIKVFDGLPTKKKLDLLIGQNRVKKKNLKKIINFKNLATKKLLNKNIIFSKKIYNIFSKLSVNYNLAIATNAISSTLDICLKKLRIRKFIKFNISNEEVNNPKPHPEIYLRCLINLQGKPNETLILEDSHYGRLAAQESGCKLFPVKKLNDVTIKSIYNRINAGEEIISSYNQPWIDNNLNILIPMAGHGSRFAKAGYVFPKPLIEVKNKPMIQWVADSLNIKANYIFIVQKEHQKKYNLNTVLKAIEPKCRIIELDTVTEGAACTTLLAKKFIDNNSPLLIANSDQYIKWDSMKTMYEFSNKNCHGGILTFESIHPKWSYARCKKGSKKVIEVAEKKVISKNATAGVYYWSKGSDYVKYAKKMIKKNVRTNNEFYVCPVFNQAIEDKKNIFISKVDEMHGLGTPEDLNMFLTNFKK